MTAAWQQVQRLFEADYDLMPLTSACLPRDKGWPTKTYDDFDHEAHLARGGALGVRLRSTDLIIDVDPRNGGDGSFDSLCIDLGLLLDRDGVPVVITGGGGRHLYYRKPA